MRRYQLSKEFANFTGMLSNVYPVKNGVAEIPDGPKEPKVLIEHYGAKRVVEAPAKPAGNDTAGGGQK